MIVLGQVVVALVVAGIDAWIAWMFDAPRWLIGTVGAVSGASGLLLLRVLHKGKDRP